MNHEKENAILRNRIERLEQELATYKMSKIDKRKKLLNELKDKKKLTTSQVIQLTKCKTYMTARVFMLNLVAEHPNLVRFSQGGKRGGSVLFWNGDMSIQEKRSFLLDCFQGEGKTMLLTEAKRFCRVDSDEEFEEICRGLPRNITLVKTADKSRWHLWRRY